MDGVTPIPTRARTDGALLEALRLGDEQAFAALVERYHGALVRTAMVYLRDREAANDVAQETWLAVIRGIDGFEGRSTLATWIFRIAANRARSRAERDGRTVPLSAFDPGPDEPSVEPSRFRPAGMAWPGHWAVPPVSWGADAGTRLLARETRSVIASALERLPSAQRAVMTMRDVHGLDAEEVCASLGITAGNQRVLLHRARSRVRAALEAYFAGSDAA